MNTIDKNTHKKMLLVLEEISEGRTTSPNCPFCDYSGLIFSFTRVQDDRYGLAIYCPRCKKYTHVRFIDRPPGFKEEFVLSEFQNLDEKAVKWAKSIFEENE